MNKPMIYEPIATNTDIPRDIRDRFADIINLLDYGTDTAAFKKAKLAAKNKHAVVYVPAGTYTLTENISDNTEDTNDNAHTFVTLGHVDTGGKCYVLDLSKAITTDKINPNDIITSNHFDNGKNIIYLNDSGQVDIHYDGGLQPVTSGGIQYLGVKGKEPITVDSEGVGLKYEPDEFKVTDGGLALTHPFDGGSYLPTSGGTMTGPINFNSSNFTSGNTGHFFTTDGNKFSIGVNNQWIDVGQGLGVSSYTGDTYTNDKTYIYAYNQYVGDTPTDRRVAFIDEIGPIVSSMLGSSSGSSGNSGTTVSATGGSTDGGFQIGNIKVNYGRTNVGAPTASTQSATFNFTYNYSDVSTVVVTTMPGAAYTTESSVTTSSITIHFHGDQNDSTWSQDIGYIAIGI